MTDKIDKFLVETGFEAEELARVKSRPFLYLAILAMAATTLTFLSLTAMAWL